MLFEDTYKAIEHPSEGIYREKGSKFIASAIPVRSEQEAKEALQLVAQRYHDARHHCYAYRIGFDGSTQRFNDDGEPSGTAGRPIMGQILSFNLTQTLIVVTRYFGGVKLGVSGLIQAYKTAAKESLQNTTILEKYVKEIYELHFDYAQMSVVMSKLKASPAEISYSRFEENCSLTFSIRKSLADQITISLKGLENCKLKFLQYE
jgi:uncharacterized YigZ family protein